MRKLLLGCIVILSAQVQAHEEPETLMLEAGIVGGNSIACPGRYVGIEGQLAGRVSLWGLVETFRCIDVAGTSIRFGTSGLLGRPAWKIRPAVRAGLEYEDGGFKPVFGAGLTLGRRYGARFLVDRVKTDSGAILVLMQMGGYIRF